MQKQVTAEVEIDFPTGKRKIQMLLKGGNSIQDCEIGKVVMLRLVNDDELTGIFKGYNGEDVMLGSLDEKVTLGYKLHWVLEYFEEINLTAEVRKHFC